MSNDSLVIDRLVKMTDLLQMVNAFDTIVQMFCDEIVRSATLVFMYYHCKGTVKST